MPFRAEWDDNELRRLGVDLSEADRRVQRGAKDQVWKAADLIARGMRREVGGHRYLRWLPQTVSREMVGPIEAEIGMETKRRQGRLAHIMAYGSVNNDPVFDHTAPLRKLTPRIVEMLADEAEDDMLAGDG